MIEKMEGKIYWLLVIYLTTVSAFTISQEDETRGRKLFGGYRIVPKVCQPTNPTKTKSNEPPICMFHYECRRRNGEVVGACMDGFLFGACCQLPQSESTLPSGAPSTTQFDEIQKIDHVPEVPILLKPDGTPVDMNDQLSTKQTSGTSSTTAQLIELEEHFPALLGQQTILDDLSLPNLLTQSTNNDIQDHQDSDSIKPVTTLLSPDQVLQIADPVDQLPALFSHGIGQNNHSGAETVLLHKNGTILNNEDVNYEQLFKPANRSTTFPTTFVTERTSSATKQITKPSSWLTMQKIRPTTQSSTAGLVKVPTISYENQSGNKKHDDSLDREEIAINHIISILNGSNPNAPVETPPRVTTQRVQTSDSTSSVHTWVTIEDTSVPSISSETFPYTYYKPSTKPQNFYYYNTSSLTSTFKKPTTKPPSLPSSSSTHSGTSVVYTYSTRPTTNPPAPTVIVLGPLGTEYTTVTSTNPLMRKPSTPPSIRPSIVTKQPSIATTITHNISTVISSSPGISGTSNVISTSYINVDVKDTQPSSPSTIAEVVTKKPTAWTTLSLWSGKPSKPSFQLKPGKPDFGWTEENLSPVQTVQFKPTKQPITPTTPITTNCDDVTAPPDDQSAFPPDRNPNLTDSAPLSQQEKPPKPTIIEGYNNTGYPEIELVSENDIPTPAFIEDDVLKNKVDDFVKKIVNSLEGNFQNLKDIVYTRKNVTIPTTSSPTKKPQITKRPTTKPGQLTTKRPTKRPSSSKPGVTSAKPVKTKPATVSAYTGTTKRPSGPTKRPKPTKRLTTAAPTSVTISENNYSPTPTLSTQSSETDSTDGPSTTPNFRTQCGVRPLIKKGRIVGGKGATFGKWPWQVLVREATWLGLFTKNKCGGVLITDKYVITAAHCQPGFLASLVAVFGEFDISGELESRKSVTRNVKRVIVNRGYNPATFENDLALLELETPVQFDAHIVPICMPDDGADFTGQMATVTGWGRVKYNGGVPSVLQEVQVPVMENPVCQELFRKAGHSKLILDSFLCAGYTTGEKDSCEGDSGGPLMMESPDGKWILVGTVSHGIKCAAPFLPGVYMRTTYFKPWLHSVTGV